MRILAIETSCDETALAIISDATGSVGIERHLVSSQVDIHAKYGGVVPEVAARAHIERLFPMLDLLEIPRDGNEIDAVAVTAGPGLLPALRIGVETAKALSWSWQKPLVPVNHLEGHIYSVWRNQTEKFEIRNPKSETNSKIENRKGKRGIPEFPAVALIVSGGHTELILMRGHGLYERLGETRDDAAGEAFDKTAKLLGLGYPGGAMMGKLAAGSLQQAAGKIDAVAFPRPMMDSGDLDFSFSGLKTAVLHYVKGTAAPAALSDVCASIQEAIVDCLVLKTQKAIEKVRPKSLCVVGGVSANRRLRERMQEMADKEGVTLFVPDLSLTGDNAAMIGIAGYFNAKAGKFVDPLTLAADPGLRLGESSS
ncbi:tRNA (adenosine(37)-N6)-threonylcarbamoyltransferase complex transferase subunit TsaD [Candidatus Uhrbacteria bacterium]|nr:tRNA (adenosine(37)-N6)-threonylcarbamoyltransferase complex transferase subunit TsaD [Candidatus Uhrbacteria bacterium]